jgi:hypothetical protein
MIKAGGLSGRNAGLRSLQTARLRFTRHYRLFAQRRPARFLFLEVIAGRFGDRLWFIGHWRSVFQACLF